MTENDASSPSPYPPKPHPELRRLDPLVGKWLSKDHTTDSALGPGVPVESIETFAWLDGGYFLVSTYETAFGDEPIQRGVMYWGYDAETKRFHNRFFSNNGPYDPAGSEYVGAVEGDKLTFVGLARFQYDLDSDGRIKTNRDGSISVAWWLRDEHGDWHRWMNNTFFRTRVLRGREWRACRNSVRLNRGEREMPTKIAAADEAQILQRMESWTKALRAKDLDELMDHYAQDVLVFDLAPPLQYQGAAAYGRNWAEWFPSFQGPVGYEIRD